MKTSPTTTKQPLVSVIIPAFNAGKLITETLISIKNQSYQNIEIIVVDDGSTDNTRNTVESFDPNIKYIYQDNSGGCSSPRNNGFKHSKGDFVHFFDADDLMLTTNIENKVNYLLKHPDIGFVCSNFANFRLENNTKILEKEHFSTCPILTKLFTHKEPTLSIRLRGTEARRIMLQESFSNAGSVMFPREVFSTIGKFDEALTSSEDFDINYRTLLEFDCGIINELGFYRRLHGENMTANPVKMYENGIRSAQKLVTLEQSAENRRHLQNRIIIRLSGLARFYRGKNNIKSLGYSTKSIQYIKGHNKQTLSLLIRNIAAALLRRA